MDNQEWEWDEEDYETFRMALHVMPYVAAVLNNDQDLLITLAKSETTSLADISTGLFGVVSLLINTLAEILGTDQMEVYRTTCEYLNEQLGTRNNENL